MDVLGAAGAGALLTVSAPGSIYLWAVKQTSASDTGYWHYDGRQVLYTGEKITVGSNQVPWWITISGYELTV